MLICSGVPQNLYEKLFLIANYILNKLPHKKFEETPYEL